jgi:hypothetical protein
MEVEASDVIGAWSRDLSSREKMFILLHYLRQSGIQGWEPGDMGSMYEQPVTNLAYAQAFGIYIGLLRYPADYYWAHENDRDWTLLYQEFLSDLEEGGNEQYAVMAEQLPFTQYSNGLIDEFAKLSDTRTHRHVGPQKAMSTAVYAMAFIGDRRFRAAKKRHGEAWAANERSLAIAVLPHYGPEYTNLMYGISQFSDFITTKQNVAVLDEAMRKEKGVQLRLNDFESLRPYKCSQCKQSFASGLRERDSKLEFCSLACQHYYHYSLV